MEYLVTGRQAKAIDTYTIEQTGIPSLVLMERASLCVAEEVQKTADQMHLPVVRIAVVCGSGNNGGDGCLYFPCGQKRENVRRLSETISHCRKIISAYRQWNGS